MAMRYAEALGSGLHGIEATLVRIEVSIQNGLPSFEIVGLCGSDIKEARERVRAAIRSSGYEFPTGRITANFAPAWIHKQGTCFDLPLALSLLAASGQAALPGGAASAIAFGELSLTGEVRGVNGAIGRAAVAAEHGIRTALVPVENRREVEAVRSLRCLPVRSLREAAERLSGKVAPTGPASDVAEEDVEPATVRRPVEVHGQGEALLALEIAAAGRHHLLLVGSPGSGKSLLASHLPSLLPPLDEEEAFEVTRIHSAAGLLPAGSGLVRRRPFRSPHHTATAVALVGGGSRPAPGEATLAHRGVLFLDEMAEFSGRALDALRTPMEEGVVRLSRGGGHVELPADFMLVGATNPCPCGDWMEEKGRCRCSQAEAERYLARIDGPLADRMDLRVDVRRTGAEAMRASASASAGRGPAEMRARVVRAWEIQRVRNAGGASPVWNSRIPGDLLQTRLGVGDAFLADAARYAESKRLSVRGFHKVLRVARTVADLRGAGTVDEEDFAAAMRLRVPSAPEAR